MSAWSVYRNVCSRCVLQYHGGAVRIDGNTFVNSEKLTESTGSATNGRTCSGGCGRPETRLRRQLIRGARRHVLCRPINSTLAMAREGNGE